MKYCAKSTHIEEIRVQLGSQISNTTLGQTISPQSVGKPSMSKIEGCYLSCV